MTEFDSKSQRKREATALQALGEALAELNEQQLSSIPLNDGLLKAIHDQQRIRSHGAKKRQNQYIGSLMRKLDDEEVTAIQDALQAFQQMASVNTAQFHEIEQWRDRFIAGDKAALTAFLDSYDCEDIQQLRQAISKAQKEAQKQQNLGGAKALFRLLKSIILR